MKRLLRALAACLIVASPLAAAIPAQASMPAWFDMIDNNAASQDFGYFIDDQSGAGHQLVVSGTGGTDFQLINKNVINGITTWEIADGIGCMNATNSTGVYINSCIAGDSNEEWISTGATHYWDNVHRGANGYLNIDCPFNSCTDMVVSVSTAEPWATPGS